MGPDGGIILPKRKPTGKIKGPEEEGSQRGA
jgi:hypothetical protein